MINRGTLYITLIFCVIFIFSYFYNIIKEYRKTKVMKFYFMEYLVSFLLAICSIFFISMVYKLGIWKNLIAIFLFLLVSIIYFYNVIKGRPKKNLKKDYFIIAGLRYFICFLLFFTRFTTGTLNDMIFYTIPIFLIIFYCLFRKSLPKRLRYWVSEIFPSYEKTT